ncbi:MAG: response regulator transcription factor [Acidobacteriota bacterium]
MNARVLVVDADLHAAKTTTTILLGRGCETRTVVSAEAAHETIRTWRPALVIAALEMTPIDGSELCHCLRQASSAPLIAIASNTRAEVAALDSGADDYLVRPITADQLMARVRVALRRSALSSEMAEMGVGEFHIDFHGRRVHVHGQPVRLTPKEFDLFVFMARHPNRVLPHRTLLGAVWGEGSADQSEYLRVFVGQLRKKLEHDPSNPRYLVTEPWVGYRFNPDGLAH